MIRTSKEHISKRGLFLVLFGLAYLVIGLAYIRGPISPAARVVADFHEFITPMENWGYVWALSGAIVLIGGLFRSYGKVETLGYSVAEFMPMIWSMMYFISQFTGGQAANRAWLNGTVFLVMAAAVFCVAGMIDPKDVRRDIRNSKG